MQKLSDFRIARKVNVPHIVQPHDAGQRTGTFYRQSVIKHFDLDVCPFDAVITVCNGVDDQFFPGKLRVFRLGNKTSICAEIGTLLDLAAHKLQRFFNDLQDAAFKHNVLDDIHLCADPSFRALISDKADACAGKIVFRIFAKQ